VALLAPENHVVKFDFQAWLSFDRLQARITSTKSRRFFQVAANDSFRATTRELSRVTARIETPMGHFYG
jgi:hypothetical protein